MIDKTIKSKVVISKFIRAVFTIIEKLPDKAEI